MTSSGGRHAADDLRDDLEDLRARVLALEKSPIDVSKMMFSAQAFIGALAMIGAIIGGSYWVNGEARQDGRDIKFMIEERTKAQDKTNSDLRAAQDKTNLELRGAIESVQRELKSTEERLRAEIRMKEYTKANGLRQP